MRVLSAADVQGLVDLPQAMACVEQAFRDHAAGAVDPWPPTQTRSGGSILMTRAGGLPAQSRMGVRLLTGGKNPGIIVLYETPGGRPVGLMTYPFAELRVCASVGVGVRALAPLDARRLGLIGTGRLALRLLQTICSLRTVESVTAFSRAREPRIRFAAEASEALGLPIIAAESATEAVSDAHIVVVATTSETPALDGRFVASDALVVSIGTRTELDEQIYRRASLIVTASREQELEGDESQDWTLVRLMRSGALRPTDVVEIGQIIVGNLTRPRGICVYRGPHSGFLDIAVASQVYDRAVQLSRGIEWEAQ